MTKDSIGNYWIVPIQFVKKECRNLKDFLENYCGYKILDDNSIRKNSIVIGAFSDDEIIISYDLNSPRQIEEAGRLKRILDINEQRHIEKPSMEELVKMGRIRLPKEEIIFIEK